MARKKAEKEIVELSEEEQPYELPEGWKWEMLENVCDSIKAGGDKPKAISKDKTVDMPIPVVANGIENEGIVGYTNIIGNEGNSVTVSGRGTIGKSFYRKEAYFPIVRVIVLNPSSNIKPQYLKYIFDCFEEKSTGSSIPQLTVPKIKVKIIPLPPKETQQKIVDIIESLFAKLDIAQEKVEQVLAESENRRATILHKAFSGELTEKWRKENKKNIDEWLDTILMNCANKIGDGLHGTPAYNDNGKYYFINGNNFDGIFINIKNDTKKVDKSEYEKYKINLSSNTVFVSINGTLGKTAFYNDEDIILGKSACYINVKENIAKEFLRYYFLSKEFIDYANENATGSTIKNLGLKAVRNMPIKLPTVLEQREIVRLLDKFLSAEDTVKSTCQSILETIATMRKSILAKAFRGELCS